MKKNLILLQIFFLFVTLAYSDPPDWEQLQGTQYSMVVMARISLYDEPFEYVGNNMAAAFGPNGEDDCRAVATWQEANPPYYEGFWFFTIVSNLEGELITFKIYNEETDTIYNCDGSVTFANNTTIGSPQEPYLLSVGTSSLSGTLHLVTTNPPAGNIQEVDILIGGQIVHPDSNGEYTVQLDTGVYNIEASLDGYLTSTRHNVQVSSDEPSQNIDLHLIDWEPISGTQYSMVVMTTAVYNGNTISNQSDFHIAAFGEDGDTDCRGIGVWQEANPPYWDGYWYITIVGNQQGENISFKMFNEHTGEIIDCFQTTVFSDNSTIGSATEPWQISNGVLRNYNLDQGWNWVSFNIEPENTEISGFFANLQSVYQVKNQYHSATYFSEQNVWVGDLHQIDFTKTYLIFMLDNFDGFTVSGVPFDPTVEIPLNSGWNWVSYLPQNQMNLEDALSSIEENVYQIKSQNHSATYYNPPGSWVGDLQTMSPGLGYKINVNNDDILSYIDDKSDKNSKDTEETKDSPTWEVITGTEYSMVLMAKVMLDDDDFTGENGENIVAAFGPEGESDCRSVAVWEDETENWDGYWYFTIVGDTEGEQISFKIYDAENDEVYNCETTLEFSINQTIGNPFDPYEITANSQHAQDNEISVDFTVYDVYPNPYSLNGSKTSKINFEYYVKDVQPAELSIYNLKGQLIKKLLIIM